MTTRKKLAEPTEMEKALKLLDAQIKELEADIARAKSQIEALYQMRRSFENLQALEEQRRVRNKQARTQ